MPFFSLTVSQVENNIKALEFELSPDEIKTLNALYRPRDVINDHVPNRMPRHLGGMLDKRNSWHSRSN